MIEKVLIKIGGRAFENTDGLMHLAKAIKKINEVGFLIVHGGGREISQVLKKSDRDSVFIDGLRVTSATDIKIIENVLSEKINRRIASVFNQLDVNAKRMFGNKNGIFLVEPMRKNGYELGFVGKIVKVNPESVEKVLENKKVPIISPVSADIHGKSYNVNADAAAAALAAKIKCRDLIYFTDVDGVQIGGKKISELSVNEAEKLISRGIIKDGMVAKLISVFEALKGGVKNIHIAKWQGMNSLQEIIENRRTIGTTIYR